MARHEPEFLVILWQLGMQNLLCNSTMCYTCTDLKRDECEYYNTPFLMEKFCPCFIRNYM
jgi:hypothetical protein